MRSFTHGLDVVPDDYEGLGGDDKQRWLWEQCQATEYSDLPPIPKVGAVAGLRLAGALLRHGLDTYRSTTDTWPWREKLSHPRGVVCAGTFEPTGLGSGGVLDGAPLLCRLSLSGDPEQAGYQPGLALKFLIDAHPSVNVHLADSVDGQDDRDFFSRPFRNRLPGPTTSVGRASRTLLRRVTRDRDPFQLDLDHLVFRDRAGGLSGVREAPRLLEARSDLSSIADGGLDFREVLGRIEVGSVLFDVWLQQRPGSELRHVGRIRTQSALIASAFGDHVLHFHHRRHGI